MARHKYGDLTDTARRAAPLKRGRPRRRRLPPWTPIHDPTARGIIMGCVSRLRGLAMDLPAGHERRDPYFALAARLEAIAIEE